MALALFIDPVSQIAHTPFVHLGKGTVLALDYLFESLDKFLDSCSPFRMNDE
jgi:hypothetical protein